MQGNEMKHGKGEPKKDRFTYLTETPVPRLIRELSVPTIISMLVTGIYNAADTFFVGRISTQATAAVGLVFSVMAIIQAFGFFCGHGSGNYLSRMLGGGKIQEANEAASTGFALAMSIGIVFSCCGIIFLEPLAMLIGATSTTLADTRTYLGIILLGAPFMMCQFVINNQLRFQGSAIYAMIGLMCGAVINLFLDPLLIFGFHLGVAGAAIATVCGQITSFIALLIGSGKGENIHLSPKKVRFTRHYILEIINGGAPSLCRQGLASVATLLLNTSAGALGGDAAIAGMSVVTRVMMLLSSALIGFGQGFQPVCSFNYGAKKTSRVKEGFWYCVRVGTVFLLFMAVLCLTFAPRIIALFRNDPDVIAVGSVALRWQAAVLPTLAFTFTSNMMLQAMGKGVKASICSAARSGIFFIPLILSLPRFFGLAGVEAAQSIADLLSLGLAIPFAWSELRHMGSDEPK